MKYTKKSHKRSRKKYKHRGGTKIDQLKKEISSYKSIYRNTDEKYKEIRNYALNKIRELESELRDEYIKNISKLESETLPPNWKTATDPKTGRVYYYNEITKETSWDKEGISKLKSGDLPPNWKTVTDPKTGSLYYYNEITNETTWDKPKYTSVEHDDHIGIGDYVLVDGLEKSPEYNGKIGIITRYNTTNGRYIVKLSDTTQISILPKNLMYQDIYTNTIDYPNHENVPAYKDLYNGKKFIFIHIPGDGNCGYHSILGATNQQLHLKNYRYKETEYGVANLRKIAAHSKYMDPQMLEIASASDNCTTDQYISGIIYNKYIDQPEIEALSSYYKRPIIIHDQSSNRIIIHGKNYLNYEPIHLHYTSAKKGERDKKGALITAHYSLLIPF